MTLCISYLSVFENRAVQVCQRNCHWSIFFASSRCDSLCSRIGYAPVRMQWIDGWFTHHPRGTSKKLVIHSYPTSHINGLMMHCNNSYDIYMLHIIVKELLVLVLVEWIMLSHYECIGFFLFPDINIHCFFNGCQEDSLREDLVPFEDASTTIYGSFSMGKAGFSR